VTFSSHFLKEPLLEFANGQKVEHPQDGLYLYGPVKSVGVPQTIQVGVVGTPDGIALAGRWLLSLQGAISVTRLVGVRIRSSQELRLFRPNADVPVLRGTAVLMTRREGYLWTNGYVPRLRTYPGFETPKPVAINVDYGTADLLSVMTDVLALTKVNYNACDFSSGLPVTLKFADRVGEILTASPRGLQAPPLPFRFYI
jgi:hypothetical protein